MVFAWQYRYERYRGGNQFTWLTDNRIRDVARLLERYNPIAQGILNGLRMYVLGDKGMSPEVLVRPGMDEELQQMAHAYLDAFRDREDMHDRERELYNRFHRDGEAVIRFYYEDGGVVLRPVEPEYIVAPTGEQEWSFGFYNEPGDIERITAMNVMYQDKMGSAPQNDIVDAADYYHMKSGVDRSLKRGLSDFASTAQIVEEAMKCLKNMMRAETIRQGITYITQYPNATPQDVEAYVAAQTNYVDRVGVGPGVLQSQPTPVNISEGVGEIHLPGTQQLASAPSSEGTEKAVMAMNAALLAVGSRYHMPQWLINGDASRNNAIDLGGESPFGKFCADEQRVFSKHMRNIYWRILAIGIENGDLPEAVLDHVDIVVKPQQTFNRDPDLETKRLKTLAEDGLLSPQTRAAKEGLDYQTEQELIKESKQKDRGLVDAKSSPQKNGKVMQGGGRGAYIAN